MIELNTGVPGSGKTLSMVERLAKLQARWEAHPEEARPVFVLGIPDLILPHSPLPLKSVQVQKSGSLVLVPDWDEMPDGSLAIIDESQGTFPPRSTASTAPAHVAFLNTHRHRGFDIWLTTQHPKLIDSTVRALVGKHQHYRRLFGGARACVYEWDSCSDNLSGTANAVKSFYNYPKKVFKWYKSAEVHNKQSFKLPLWVFVPLFGVVMGLYFIPKAYGVLSGGVSGKSPSGSPVAVTAPAASGQNPSKIAPQPVALVKASYAPQEAAEPLQISACMSIETKCQCYTHHGIKLVMPEPECRAAAISTTLKFRLDEQRKEPQMIATK